MVLFCLATTKEAKVEKGKGGEGSFSFHKQKERLGTKG